jgi:hypothetical protein
MVLYIFFKSDMKPSCNERNDIFSQKSDDRESAFDFALGFRLADRYYTLSTDFWPSRPEGRIIRVMIRTIKAKASLYTLDM